MREPSVFGFRILAPSIVVGILLALMFLFGACSPKPEKINEPETSAEPVSLEDELTSLRQSYENELKERVDLEQKSSPSSDADPEMRQPLTESLPREHTKKLVKICTPTAEKPPTFRIRLSFEGIPSEASLLESSGASECDTLIGEMLLKSRWEPCDDQSVTCTFNYSIAYPRDPIK